MKIQIFNFVVNDGSRNFMDLPEDLIGWNSLYEYLGLLDGAEKTGYLTDRVTEVWMDFSFRGYDFSVNNQMGNYWFFAENPQCPEDILLEIAVHCEKLFDDRRLEDTAL